MAFLGGIHRTTTTTTPQPLQAGNNASPGSGVTAQQAHPSITENPPAAGGNEPVDPQLVRNASSRWGSAHQGSGAMPVQLDERVLKKVAGIRNGLATLGKSSRDTGVKNKVPNQTREKFCEGLTRSFGAMLSHIQALPQSNEKQQLLGELIATSAQVTAGCPEAAEALAAIFAPAAADEGMAGHGALKTLHATTSWGMYGHIDALALPSDFKEGSRFNAVKNDKWHKAAADIVSADMKGENKIEMLSHLRCKLEQSCNQADTEAPGSKALAQFEWDALMMLEEQIHNLSQTFSVDMKVCEEILGKQYVDSLKYKAAAAMNVGEMPNRPGSNKEVLVQPPLTATSSGQAYKTLPKTLPLQASSSSASIGGRPATPAGQAQVASGAGPARVLTAPEMNTQIATLYDLPTDQFKRLAMKLTGDISSMPIATKGKDKLYDNLVLTLRDSCKRREIDEAELSQTFVQIELHRYLD